MAKTDKKTWKVVQSNNFVQTTSNDLDKNQKKIMAYIFSTVRKDDKEFKNFSLSVTEMISLMNKTDGGKNYDAIKSALKDLADKSWWVYKDKNPDEIELVRFFDRVTINSAKKTITGKLHDSLKPYLLELTGNYHEYQLTDYFTLTKESSLNLYPWLKSWQGKGCVTRDIEDIMKVLNVENSEFYAQFKYFNQRILKPAVNEINDKTDLYITYKPNKPPGSKSYSTITFVIKTQNQPIAYGDYKNVFLSEEELNQVVYEWHAKYLIYELSRYKYINKINRRKGDFTTLKKWYKKECDEREAKKTDITRPEPISSSEISVTNNVQVTKEDMDKYLPDEQTHFEFDNETGGIEKEPWFPFE